MNLTRSFFVSSIFFVSSSLINTAIADDFHLMLNATPTKGNGIFDNVNNGDRAVVNLTLNHSYCCSVFSPSNDASKGEDHPGISSIVSGVGNHQIPFEKNSGITPAFSYGDRSARACFTTADDSTFVVNTAPFYINLNIPDGTANDLQIQCDDTTLDGSFNTFASDYVFLEIINNTETDTFTPNPRVVTVTALDSDNSELFSLPVAVARRTDIDIHSRVGINKIGAIRVNHLAPKGTIVGYVAEYKIDPTVKSGLTLLGRQQLISK